MSRQPTRVPGLSNPGGSYSNLDGPPSPGSPSFTRSGNPGGSSPLNPTRGLYDALRGTSSRRDESPRDGGSTTSGSRSAGSSIDYRGNGTTAGVVTGAIGGGYGPYSYEPVNNSPLSPSATRPSRDSSLPPPSSRNGPPSRYSSRVSSAPSPFAAPPSSSGHSSRNVSGAAGGAAGASALKNAPVWTARDAELDDKLHDASPHDSLRDRNCTAFSLRGWLNMGAIVLLVAGLVMLFAGYPILDYYTKQALSNFGAFNVGGVNSTGQVPDIPGLPTLIDKDTPAAALTRTGFDGRKYVLMFSDEFETEGRTFWPGDDPFWEAVDLHYWATGDFEWYDPDAVTTKEGSLVITASEEPIHGLNFRSGMLQSWNKFCFTGGYIEVSVQLPGASNVGGLWPGAWTLGNLARAGYGATTDGMWPYSYNTCDLGTLPNQTNIAGTGPPAALDTGNDGAILSYLPGQRLSACTCPGSDHPGPNVKTGRGAPEIDVLEAEVTNRNRALRGAVSQSAQFAPFDDYYSPVNTTPATVVYDSSRTWINSYKGGVYQQAASGVTYTVPAAYELGGGEFSKYGWEAWPDPTNGYITWSVGETASWTLTAAAVGPNPRAQIGQRLISAEPMSIILNLGISDSFQRVDFENLVFPTEMKIDYVRVYQREDEPNIGCDPPTMPTSDYIERHLAAYTNPNLTTWDHAGYKYPKNSMQGC